MINKKDIRDLCLNNNIELNDEIIKDKKLDDLVRLLNYALSFGGVRIELKTETFYEYMGKRYFSDFLFSSDFRIDTDIKKKQRGELPKKKNVDFFENVDKQLTKKAFFMNHFFRRLHRGYNYIQPDKSFFCNNFQISNYMLNEELLELYNRRFIKLTNKKALKLITNKYLEVLIEKEDINENKYISKLNNEIVKPVKINLDKDKLKKFFIDNVKNYRLDVLKKDKKNVGRTFNSLLKQRTSFIKSNIEFQDFFSKTSLKYYEVKYTQTRSGRYYSWLGQLDKRIRNHILDDFIEIDLDTAAPNCLYQTYLKLNDKRLILIEELLNKKKKVRSYIGAVIFYFKRETSKEIQIMYSKKFLTSLFFGSTPSYIGTNATNDILKEVSNITGVNIIEIKKFFYNNDIIKEFIYEVKIMMDTVDEMLKSNTDLKTNRMSINNNTIDVTPKKGKSKQNTRLAYYYQNWEANFLNAEVKILNDLGIKKNYFKLHDAIYIHKDVFIEKKITENELRDLFREIRIKGNEFDIKPIL